MDGAGRAFLADLRIRNDSLLAHHTIYQGFAAVILGAGWWFKGLIELLSAQAGDVSGLVIFYIALPAIIIVALWVHIFNWLLNILKERARKHVRVVFERHDIALMAMGTEFPENVRREIEGPRKARLRQESADTRQSFAKQVELIISRYNLIARGLGEEPLPRGWLLWDVLLLPLIAVSGFLAFSLPLGPGQFLAFLTGLLALVGVKHTLFTVRLYAIRSALVAGLSADAELRD